MSKNYELVSDKSYELIINDLFFDEVLKCKSNKVYKDNKPYNFDEYKIEDNNTNLIITKDIDINTFSDFLQKLLKYLVSKQQDNIKLVSLDKTNHKLLSCKHLKDISYLQIEKCTPLAKELRTIESINKISKHNSPTYAYNEALQIIQDYINELEQAKQSNQSTYKLKKDQRAKDLARCLRCFI